MESGMDYPQQTKIHGMIELMYRKLQKAYEQGESDLGVVYIAGSEDVGVYLRDNTASENNVAKVLGVSGGEAVGLFRYVCREGYVGLSLGSHLSSTFNRVTVDYITPLGLLEPNVKTYLTIKEIRGILSVSKTKAHQIAHQIRDEDEDPDAVIKFGRCPRVSEEALMRFIKRHRYRKD
jgi:hypothetical protein